MILKVEMHDERNDYWLLDKIDKIYKSGILYYSSMDFDMDNVYIMSYIAKKDSKGQGKYVEIICHRENGARFTVNFDSIAYICNDEGKTLERIYVNDDRKE